MNSWQAPVAYRPVTFVASARSNTHHHHQQQKQQQHHSSSKKKRKKESCLASSASSLKTSIMCCSNKLSCILHSSGVSSHTNVSCKGFFLQWLLPSSSSSSSSCCYVRAPLPPSFLVQAFGIWLTSSDSLFPLKRQSVLQFVSTSAGNEYW